MPSSRRGASRRLLSGRCAEIGITFAVDVRVRDMDRVLALAL